MNYKRFLIAAILFMIIAQIIHTIGAVLSMKYYMMPEYFSVWSKIMMPKPGPPPASFTYYSLLFGFISALIYVAVYDTIKSSLPGSTPLKKGIYFGFFILFLTAGLPGMMSLLLLVNLPSGLIMFWTLENLIIALIGGGVIGIINK